MLFSGHRRLPRRTQALRDAAHNRPARPSPIPTRQRSPSLSAQPARRRRNQISVVAGKTDQTRIRRLARRGRRRVANAGEQEGKNWEYRRQDEGDGRERVPRKAIARDEPDFFVRNVAVPDHQHGHEIDVGDAENGGEEQAADIADGRVIRRAAAPAARSRPALRSATRWRRWRRTTTR